MEPLLSRLSSVSLPRWCSSRAGVVWPSCRPLRPGPPSTPRSAGGLVRLSQNSRFSIFNGANRLRCFQ